MSVFKDRMITKMKMLIDKELHSFFFFFFFVENEGITQFILLKGYLKIFKY